MASRGRRGGVSAREDEPRRDERAEQQAPAPQGPVLPPPPPVDYGVFMQGLVQAMQTQAHTQAALQAQLDAQKRADVWWASLLCTLFEDGVVDVAWDEFVRLFWAKFVPEHVHDQMEQEFLSLAQGSMTIL
ncbi:hypothetical protein Taro_036653 [Colocasia esculenta]|uniref:Retrotransposon gag domain-containing protein n=1 Tax=Colocasia esculenta TaxID=4460 RepID=A0A843WAG2_COLES|nr:hypothetical protein [Colocasia esculenta]